MKIALEKVEPAQIEKRSFEIIGEELGERSFPKLHEPIIKRCIHTSADFDYADNLVFSEHAHIWIWKKSMRFWRQEYRIWQN